MKPLYERVVAKARRFECVVCDRVVVTGDPDPRLMCRDCRDDDDNAMLAEHYAAMLEEYTARLHFLDLIGEHGFFKGHDFKGMIHARHLSLQWDFAALESSAHRL